MSGSQATIKDIAKILGISPSTVSRALKDHPDISQQTKDAVLSKAKELNYRPNAIALSLRNRKSNTIGIIIPQVVHYFFSTIISGIEEVAHREGYNVLICQSNESIEREIEIAYTLLSNRIDGVLVSITKETDNSDHLKELVEQGIPVVFFDRMIHDIKTDKVIVDDHDGAFKAVEHLLEKGRRRIVHFAGPQNRLIGLNRMNGYRHALEKYRIPIDDDLIIHCDNYDDALKLTPEVFSKPEPPDAIFAVNDITAIGAMKALRKLGINVPIDVSVVGFEDSLYAKIVDPELTTVLQPGFDMGTAAAELLFRRLKNTDQYIEPKHKVLKTELRIRNSS